MRKVILGEVLDVKRGASLSGEYYATEGNLVRLTLGNFNYPGGGFKKNTSKSDIYFNGPVKPEHILKKGDIITPLTEQVAGLLGETATIPESDKYIQSGDVGLVIPNEKLLDRRFAYYLLASPIIKKQLGAAAQQTKIRHTSPDAIKACEAWIPEDIGTQKAIGQLLDDINDKITNNNAICSDLEAMAKLLYDYWFVQFDFPDENGKPYKSSGGNMVWNDGLKREIPEGWSAANVGSVLDSYPKTKSVLRDDYLKGSRYPIIDQSKDYICGYTDDYDKVLQMSDAIVFGDHTNIAKYVNFNFARGADGTQIINSSNINLPNYLLYLQIQSLPVIEEGYSRHFKFLKQQMIIIPNGQVSKAYMHRIETSLLMIKGLIQENKDLASLRDFLLPMLMNGQVKVGKVGA